MYKQSKYMKKLADKIQDIYMEDLAILEKKISMDVWYYTNNIIQDNIDTNVNGNIRLSIKENVQNNLSR